MICDCPLYFEMLRVINFIIDIERMSQSESQNMRVHSSSDYKTSP